LVKPPVKIAAQASTTIKLVKHLNPQPVQIAPLASTTIKLVKHLNPQPVQIAAQARTTIKLVKQPVKSAMMATTATSLEVPNASRALRVDI
jgi:hypothetical protein